MAKTVKGAGPLTGSADPARIPSQVKVRKEARRDKVLPLLSALISGAITVKDVVRSTGVPATTVRRVLDRAKKGDVIRVPGRPRIVSESSKRALKEAITEATLRTDNFRKSDGKRLLEGTLSGEKQVTMSGRTYSRTLAELREEGVGVRPPKSTSQARVEANSRRSVAVMTPFFLQLKIIYLKYPILLVQPQRIVVADESPLPTQGEKVKGATEHLLVDMNVLSGVPRVSAMNNGSSRVTITSAVSANGRSWGNSYLVKGSHLQEKYTSPPLPYGMTQEYLDKLQILPSEAGVATKISFFKYLTRLLEDIREEIPTGPILILIDLPKVHGTLEELQAEFGPPTGEDNTGTIFHAFPANTTTKVKPLSPPPSHTPSYRSSSHCTAMSFGPRGVCGTEGAHACALRSHRSRARGRDPCHRSRPRHPPAARHPATPHAYSESQRRRGQADSEDIDLHLRDALSGTRAQTPTQSHARV